MLPETDSPAQMQEPPRKLTRFREDPPEVSQGRPYVGEGEVSQQGNIPPRFTSFPPHATGITLGTSTPGLLAPQGMPPPLPPMPMPFQPASAGGGGDLSFLMDVLTQFRQGMQEEWSQARREGVEHGNTSMALLTEFQHRMREEWSQARREGADQLGVAIQDMRQQISACREEGGSTRQLAITTSEEVGNFKQAVEGLMASTQALARKITPLPKSTGD